MGTSLAFFIVLANTVAGIRGVSGDHSTPAARLFPLRSRNWLPRMLVAATLVKEPLDMSCRILLRRRAASTGGRGIWTPDASRALAAIGNAPDAFGQTWHLPCCDDRPTYGQFVTMACEVFGRDASYTVIGKWTLSVAGIFSSQVREIRELLPRYERVR